MVGTAQPQQELHHDPHPRPQDPLPHVRRAWQRLCWMNQIVLSPRASLGVLVHEYAHAVTWDEQPAHGPRWAAAYVALVRVAFGGLGDILADRLAAEFRKIGLLTQEAAA